MLVNSIPVVEVLILVITGHTFTQDEEEVERNGCICYREKLVQVSNSQKEKKECKIVGCCCCCCCCCYFRDIKNPLFS